VVFHDVDLQHLRRCVEFARTAPAAGHGPSGVVLVGVNGQSLQMKVLYEARYRR
jgi:hypothetical protein